ncbi:hypothetical protein BGX23_008547 [Mortierella sp. AD031]|nr:hypothetical protein BGX23_008547 [Mortierella sp. AD031]
MRRILERRASVDQGTQTDLTHPGNNGTSTTTDEEKSEAAKKAAEEEAAKKAAEEEAARKAAEEEAAKKIEHEGNNGNGIPDPLEDSTLSKDGSTDGSSKTVMIASISAGVAVVAILLAGLVIQHRRQARRASAMEAYLSKRVELQPMDDNNQSTPSFPRSNNGNDGGNNGQAVYAGNRIHSSPSSRHARTQQYLGQPSPRHQHANQHYDDSSMVPSAMPRLMEIAAVAPGSEGAEPYDPPYHYQGYQTVSPVLVHSGTAIPSQGDQYDQYEPYYQHQDLDYYNQQQQQQHHGYYNQNVCSSDIVSETTEATPPRTPIFVDFPLPPLANSTSSKELAAPSAPPAAAIGSPSSAPLILPAPRDPHVLTYSESTTSLSSKSSSSLSGMMKANGTFKRSPVETLIASETDSEGGHRTVRRSCSLLFG